MYATSEHPNQTQGSTQTQNTTQQATVMQEEQPFEFNMVMKETLTHDEELLDGRKQLAAYKRKCCSEGKKKWDTRIMMMR